MTAPKRNRDRYAQPVPMPPPGLKPVTCHCGAVYLDTTGGREAHVIVFGHSPDTTPTREGER